MDSSNDRGVGVRAQRLVGDVKVDRCLPGGGRAEWSPQPRQWKGNIAGQFQGLVSGTTSNVFILISHLKNFPSLTILS